MRRQPRLGSRRFIFGTALLCGTVALSPAAAEVITIDDGATPSTVDIPFTCSVGGEGPLWQPAMGFVYRNVEAFALTPGDTIAFDIQMRVGDPADLAFLPQLDIALAHASNPLLPFKPDDLPGSDFTIVANDAIAASSGNRIVQDYDLAFTVDRSFTFPGGGLIIRVTDPRGALATRDFTGCLPVITSDLQPSGTNRLVGTFVREMGEYPWLGENTIASPQVPYVRISWTRCGDGKVTGAETCDDGNLDDLDACSNACAVAACGDGLLQRAEQCDNSVDPAKADPYCNDRCILGAVAKGSGCDAGEGAGAMGAAALLLLALLVRRRRPAQAAGAAMAVLVLSWAGSAHAQMKTDGFRVDRFEMAPTVDDGLILQDPGVLANMVWSVNATVGFTNTVLRVVPEVSSDEGVDVIGPRLSAYLDFAIGFRDRFEVNVALPFAVAQSTESGMAAGYTLRDAGSSAVGDGKLGGSVLLYGRRSGGLQLGLATALTVPIGSERSFTGDGGLGGEAQVLASVVKPRYRIILNGGVRLRPEADYVTSDQGTELIGRTGVIVPFAKQRLNTSLELDVIGRVGGSEPNRELGTPVLALLGARYHFPNGVRAGAGVGIGLTEAPGSPTVRSLITVGYSPEPKKSPLPRRPDLDRDLDRDGIIDRLDRCPADAESFNRFEDLDGCPEPDHDVIIDHAPDPLTLEQVITLPAPIEFEFDTAIMLPGAETYLLQVLQVLKNNPEVKKLEIQGHTSSEGGPEYNIRLSNARATAVFTWLVEHGVDANRLVPHGYGLTQPLVPNDSEPNRQRNRRVQFRLLEKERDPAAPTSPPGPSPTDLLQPNPTPQTSTTLRQGATPAPTPGPKAPTPGPKAPTPMK
jgi:OmpA-OmpF porin, OOP family